jgi:Flp pilus assembly protein TadD
MSARAEAAAAGATRRRSVLLTCLLLVAVGVAYVPVWSAGFLWDDDMLITANEAVRSSGGLPDIWVGRGQLDYLPLTLSLWWLECRLFGTDPTGYHAVNLALHALAVLLVWRLLLRLRVPGAFLAAALFAVHPVGVASVAWISEGKNTFSLVWLSASALAFLRAAEARRGEDARRVGGAGRVGGAHAAGRGWMLLSALLFACALLSKTAVVTAPLVFLLCVWWRWGRIARGDWFAALPLLALSLVLGLVTVQFQHSQDLGSLVVRPEGFLSRLAVAGLAPWFYAGKLLWPVGLSAVYPRWDVSGSSPLPFLPGLAWAGVLIVSWRASRAQRGWGRPVLFALGSATLLLAPAAGLVTMTYHSLSLVADHFQYAPMIALLALLAGAAARAWPGGPAAGAATAAVLVSMLVALTHQRATDWRDVETLSRALVEQRDDAWFGHANLGSILLARGDDAGAAVHLARAAELNPLNAMPFMNLAELRARGGDLAGAHALLLRAVELHPGLVEAQARLADLLLDLDRPEEAERAVRKALALAPQDTTATLVLGRLLLMRGDVAGAEALCRRAIAERPERADAHHRLGYMLVVQGRDAEAEQAFEAALALDPALPETLNNLGVLRRNRGDVEGAAELFRRALEARPGYDRARENLEALPLQ